MRKVLAALCVAVLLAACGGPAAGGQQLTVFAAASLTDAFQAMGDVFAQRYPGVDVVLNLASSSQLARQIRQGAPADVFASADERQMGTVADLLAGEPRSFARNRLEIAVEPGNPLGILGLAGLADPEVVVVLAGEEVPAGRYAAQALQKAGVEVTPASLEVDVRAALSKVALGEADAALVYTSDIAAAEGAVEGVPIPDDENVIAIYPVAVLADAPDQELAQAFVDFVLSPQGQAILAQHGFLRP